MPRCIQPDMIFIRDVISWKAFPIWQISNGSPNCLLNLWWENAWLFSALFTPETTASSLIISRCSIWYPSSSPWESLLSKYLVHVVDLSQLLIEINNHGWPLFFLPSAYCRAKWPVARHILAASSIAFCSCYPRGDCICINASKVN